jgi:hypothetical protein
MIQAFESSDAQWYYQCNITLSNTQDDPANVSYISDVMAQIATASIAQTGYRDSSGASSQVYHEIDPWA